MDNSKLIMPIIEAATPIVVTSILFITATSLGRWLETRKSTRLQALGNLIIMGAGTAYKSLATGLAAGQSVATIVKNDQQAAIQAGVDAIKTAATKDIGTLPNDATLATRVEGQLGVLMASDPNVSIRK